MNKGMLDATSFPDLKIGVKWGGKFIPNALTTGKPRGAAVRDPMRSYYPRGSSGLVLTLSNSKQGCTELNRVHQSL